jgi:hypothetical protein
MVAVGIMAPLWSRTVPLTCAESYCASIGVLAVKPKSERIRAQANLPRILKGLASLPSRVGSIARIWLFTVVLPKGYRPPSSRLWRRVVANTYVTPADV